VITFSVDLPNPLGILTFISAPAVLTNASCVLLFGTGNRYGRANDRIHELEELVQKDLPQADHQFRIQQLDAAETRTLLIVRALTCFYTAVAGFVASTLISLIGALLVSGQIAGVTTAFTVAFLCGAAGVFAMITGALMLARETRFSFRILKLEKQFISQRLNKNA
jgi:hypothetical protein